VRSEIDSRHMFGTVQGERRMLESDSQMGLRGSAGRRGSARGRGRQRPVGRKATTEQERLEEVDAFEELKRMNGEVPREPQQRKPSWLRQRAPQGERYEYLKHQMRRLGLSSVCEEAQCPNIGECWNGSRGTATIMLLGDTCTRACSFCAVNTSPSPKLPDPHEPEHVGAAVADWGVGYIVLTSVDRDDISDGGSGHFARAVSTIKSRSYNSVTVECLAPDFRGDLHAVDTLAHSGLDVYAHNLETVKRLQRPVRDARAGYEQSLRVLRRAKEANPNVVTKTSLMLGVGETKDEVVQTMRDAKDAGVGILTVGQYLQPSQYHLQMAEYVHPDMFEEYRRIGEEEVGFAYVASGPLVRSSYKADEFFEGFVRRRGGTNNAHNSDASAAGVSIIEGE